MRTKGILQQRGQEEGMRDGMQLGATAQTEGQPRRKTVGWKRRKDKVLATGASF